MAEKLSVIVPVFNGVPYLPLALNSLRDLQQLYPLEVIIQDACSTDGSSELIERYCRQEPTWQHICEADEGQSDAINRGMARATGDWVTWLCADDALLSGVAAMLTTKEARERDVLYGDVLFCLGHMMRPARYVRPYKGGLIARRGMMLEQRGTCIRRDAWHAIGGLNPLLNWTMDLDLFWRLEASGARFLKFDEWVALATIHPEAKTSSPSRERLDEHLQMLRSWQGPHNTTLGKAYLRLLFRIEYLAKLYESRPPSSSNRLRRACCHAAFLALVRPPSSCKTRQRLIEQEATIRHSLERWRTDATVTSGKAGQSGQPQAAALRGHTQVGRPLADRRTQE